VLNIGMTHADFLRGNVRLFISLLLSFAFYMIMNVGCGV
jgi:hypothetical protein